jgi:hypothetical protein
MNMQQYASVQFICSALSILAGTVRLRRSRLNQITALYARFWRSLLGGLAGLRAMAAGFIIATGIVGVLSVAVPQPAMAFNPFEQACNSGGVRGQAAACQNPPTQNPLTGPRGVIMKIATLIAWVAGIAAVIIIIVSGFSYITSNGDANGRTKARNSLISAAIGLVIIVIAQAIVVYVVNRL